MAATSQLAVTRPIYAKWGFCLVLVFIALMLACWTDGGARLCYDRYALGVGEIWRAVTAHLVHLSLPHLLLNLLGLFLICEFQWGGLPIRHGIGLLVFSAVLIDFCLWWLQPELVWYVGMSGILHGLWAGCALYGLQHTVLPQSRFVYFTGAILLIAKLFGEFYFGPSENTASLIGGNVVTASHLYGALAGWGYALTLGFMEAKRVVNTKSESDLHGISTFTP